MGRGRLSALPLSTPPETGAFEPSPPADAFALLASAPGAGAAAGAASVFGSGVGSGDRLAAAVLTAATVSTPASVPARSAAAEKSDDGLEVFGAGAGAVVEVVRVNVGVRSSACCRGLAPSSVSGPSGPGLARPVCAAVRAGGFATAAAAVRRCGAAADSVAGAET